MFRNQENLEMTRLKFILVQWQNAKLVQEAIQFLAANAAFLKNYSKVNINLLLLIQII